MPRAACVPVLLVAIAVTSAIGPTSASAPPQSMDAVLRQYARGEPVIPRLYPTSNAFLARRVELFTAARAWREQWTPLGVTFMLELGFWASRNGWADDRLLLKSAEDLVVGRPDPPGTNPAADAYEITFHRAMVGWLIGARALPEAAEYLGRLQGRVAAVAGQAPLVDPRLALSAAVLEEAWTSPGIRTGTGEQVLPSLTIAPDEPAAHDRLERAVNAFERARRLPEVQLEARIREGFVLHRLHRDDRALELLDAPVDADADPVLRYWRQLFRGRVLEARARPDGAVAAYRDAAGILPDAQTPDVALATLLQRRGFVHDARTWARQAGSKPPDALDPWWQYWSGDLRFVPTWLTALRETGP